MSGASTTPETPESRTFLLVEDNPGDARLMREAFSPVLANQLRVVSTGQEALDFVNQRGEYVDAQPPSLILLDWHLPDMKGQEVVAELYSDSNHSHIPIVVLTASRSKQELIHAYEEGVNAWISKTAELNALEEKIRGFENFWLSTARLPRLVDDK